LTELIWDGKYKNDKKVGPVRIALPFQTVETVNETAQERQLTLDLLFAGRETEWRNRLIWGDKKYVLPSLLPEFAGKVNLIYIDPPFATGANFSFNTTVPESDESFTKEPSMIEQKAYRDTWGYGLNSYLQWLYEAIVILRELLAEDGSIYIHCDWHMGHYIKLLLDEVFGSEYFRNQVIWWYYDKFPTGGNVLDRQHDFLLQYAKSERYITNRVMEPRLEPGRPTEVRKKVAGHITRISDPNTGRTTFVEGTTEKKISDVWRIPLINSMSAERIGYPTQKPEALLERIVTASSNPGDLVLDCFCGSGTTAAVAEKLRRRWITCDLGRFAIHTTRKRLLSIDNVRPFVVQNLGKYERQAWQSAEFADPAQHASVQLRYRTFILQLYHATPIDGYSWIHGVKAGRMVHVGSVDAPIALGEVKAIVNEFWRVRGKDVGEHSNGVDILGWDFAFDLNETAKQMAADANIRLAFKKIPREVLEKKAVEQGDISFYELAALDVSVQQVKKSVEVELQNFFLPPDDVPEDVKHAITHWSQWIDYWAVDWDYRDDTFHNQWQAYRTRKSPKILLKASHEYDEPGCSTVVIKVIDILGNDTTKAVRIEVK
jgi:adenine-specific DNA-methyltransferase